MPKVFQDAAQNAEFLRAVYRYDYDFFRSALPELCIPRVTSVASPHLRPVGHLFDGGGGSWRGGAPGPDIA